MNSEMKKKLKIRMKEAVEKAGGNKVLNQKTEIPLSTIGSYLSGKSEPSRDNFIKIAEAAGVSLDWLSARTDEEGLKDVVAEATMFHEVVGPRSTPDAARDKIKEEQTRFVLKKLEGDSDPYNNAVVGASFAILEGKPSEYRDRILEHLQQAWEEIVLSRKSAGTEPEKKEA